MVVFNCICCNKEIKPLYPELSNGERGMYYHGIVDSIYAGYGSRFDENKYLIAICDDCVEEKVKSGHLHLKTKNNGMD